MLFYEQKQINLPKISKAKQDGQISHIVSFSISRVLKLSIKASHQLLKSGKESETILKGSTFAAVILEMPSTMMTLASSLVHILLLCHGTLAVKIGGNGTDWSKTNYLARK